MEKEWHKIFLKYILMFGIILVFIIPPMQAPDENVHFLNAYAFMKGDLYPTYIGDSYIGREFPKEIIRYVEDWNSNDRKRADIEEVFFVNSGYINEQDVSFYGHWASDTNMLGYISSGTGMFIISLIYRIFGGNLNCYSLLLAGRICNLLFYSIIMFFAIKISPFYKKTMTLLALMPMSIFLVSSMSYDSVIIPCCFLLFSIVLKFRVERESITISWLLIMCFLSLVLFNVKTVYSPLLISLAFIPMERFGGLKNYLKAGLIIIACGLSVYITNNILLIAHIHGFTDPYRDVMMTQRAFLLDNPLRFFKTILYTINMLKQQYAVSFIGNLGKLSFSLPSLILLNYGFILVISAIIEGTKCSIFNVWHKLGFVIIFILIIYVSFAGIYTTWTAIQQGPGGSWVDGIQGRYFIPFFIFVPLLISHKPLIKMNNINSYLEIITYYTVTIVPIITIIFVILRFWKI